MIDKHYTIRFYKFKTNKKNLKCVNRSLLMTITKKFKINFNFSLKNQYFQIKNKPWPIPRTDIPWGLCQAWFDTNAKIQGITGAPIIKMIGEKRKDLIIKTPKDRILSLCHIYDCEGK